MKYDGEKIPLPDDSVDLVFVACVFHHVPPEQHISLMKECFRCLKAGGKIYVFEHNPWNPMTQWIVRHDKGDEDAILINSCKMKQRLKKAGFSSAKSRFTIFMPRKGFFKKLCFLEKCFSWIPIGAQYYVCGKKEV